MSRTKEMYMDAIEDTLNDYAIGELNAADAIKRLGKLGIDESEAEDMLQAYMS